MVLSLQSGTNMLADTDVLELEGGETFVAADTGDADVVVGEVQDFEGAEGLGDLLDEGAEDGDDGVRAKNAGIAGVGMGRRQALQLLLTGVVSATVLPNGGCKKDEEKRIIVWIKFLVRNC